MTSYWLNNPQTIEVRIFSNLLLKGRKDSAVNKVLALRTANTDHSPAPGMVLSGLSRNDPRA